MGLEGSLHTLLNWNCYTEQGLFHRTELPTLDPDMLATLVVEGPSLAWQI